MSCSWTLKDAFIFTLSSFFFLLKASIIESTGSVGSCSSMMSAASLPILESDEMGSSGLGNSAISGRLLNSNTRISTRGFLINTIDELLFVLTKKIKNRFEL